MTRCFDFCILDTFTCTYLSHCQFGFYSFWEKFLACYLKHKTIKTLQVTHILSRHFIFSTYYIYNLFMINEFINKPDSFSQVCPFLLFPKSINIKIICKSIKSYSTTKSFVIGSIKIFNHTNQCHVPKIKNKTNAKVITFLMKSCLLSLSKDKDQYYVDIWLFCGIKFP